MTSAAAKPRTAQTASTAMCSPAPAPSKKPVLRSRFAFVTDTDPVVKSIGLSLAFGVLADAFVVRMTLVPAAMALLGRRAWWMPKRLERIVPDVDIEGEAVMKGLHGASS